MYKKDITFTDFEGNEVTETHYFNLSKSEIAELMLVSEGDHEEGLVGMIEEIVKSQDRRRMIDTVKMIVRLSYGVRSDDGRRFIKSPELYEQFTQTGAYDVFFMDILTKAEATAEFIIGIVPSDLNPEEHVRTAMALDNLKNDGLETVELPEPASEKLPWADREPTKAELANMTRDQLVEVMQRKTRS